MSFLNKIFGFFNKREMDKLWQIVAEINALEDGLRVKSDEEIKNETTRLRGLLAEGKTLDDVLVPAFAVVREAARRVLGMRHFDVQMIGGIILHRGQISEMKTGEGKTLVATLPLYLNALTGQGGHLVTPNDYLSRHGAGWMGAIYNFLGLSTAVIVHDTAYIYDVEYNNEEFIDEYAKHLKPVTRRGAYNADILYGTNNEFGFDYLRDNMVPTIDHMVQRPLHFAIVDEVDSILIDEARTPLIISAPAEESTDKYRQFSILVRELRENEHYNIDEKRRAATLTEDGIKKLEDLLGVENIYVEEGISTVHHLEQALRANTLFKRDKDYVVQNGEIIIIDEFTGRMLPGRRYSEGLHQAIEAKEGVDVKRESRTMATITFQNYFRLYKKLAGMTGTASTEAEEFSKIYKLEVVEIPTNKPMRREDLNDKIYKTEEAKFKAVVEKVKECRAAGQPVLIGTISIEKNEILGYMMEKEGIPHEILNAKQHEREAQIIAKAGRLGAVTVATNMAGRGVDIMLGGEAPKDVTSEGYRVWKEEHDKILAVGGLMIIGTERHESRRIDNQLRGRAGRQGDPGVSQFFVSMDDDLMRIFGSDRMKSLMTTLRVPEDLPIENSLLSKSLESAQRKVEGHNFDIRKHVLEYDDVINKHREVIYRRRKKILELYARELAAVSENKPENPAEHEAEDAAAAESLETMLMRLVRDEIESVVMFHTSGDHESDWDLTEIYEVCGTIFNLPDDARLKIEEMKAVKNAKNPQVGLEEAIDRIHIIDYLETQAKLELDRLIGQINKSVGNEKAFLQVLSGIMVRSLDDLWVEHLETMDHLRTGIGLRGYGQRDPLVEYKKEAYELFQKLVSLIDKQVVYSIYKVGLAQNLIGSGLAQEFVDNQSSTLPKNLQFTKDLSALAQASGIIGNVGPVGRENAAIKTEKIGRNEPCPCGATHSDGRPIKYKQCHGRNL